MKCFGGAILAGFLALGLAACNPVANLAEADDQIDMYQMHYSFDEHEDMYKMIGPEFRKMSSREEFDEFATFIDNRLGEIVNSERVNFSVNAGPLGTTTVVIMQTQFKQGEGTETYTFLGESEEMVLEGWQVNSDRLAITPAEARQLNESAGQSEAAD